MPLFGTCERSRFWLCTDGCGLTCATVTWTLHIYAWAVVNKLLLRSWFGWSFWGMAHSCLYTCIVALALISHGRAMLTDPGAVPSDAYPLPHHFSKLEAQGGWRKRRCCAKCGGMFKPPRAHHDSVTDRCILKMDHFCPWVNNAVGLFNHKFFLLFVLYTMLSCGYTLALVVSRFVFCVRLKPYPMDEVAAAADEESCDELGLLTILVVMEGVLFGLFTMCMLCDQSPMLFSNLTKIDRLKGEKQGAHGKVNEIFGTRTSCGAWLSPFHDVYFPRDIFDDVVGFIQRSPESNVSAVLRMKDEEIDSLENGLIERDFGAGEDCASSRLRI
uniref:Palmitoyltransferase n=2 Tax=Rhizochromulina marina TaxID=1034831 RepID=A0A7S2W6V2_9STRA|mmetsp:Transcript_16040/g.47045  ORF Transcript_16040/g.47045 Transcript_16040/m.47045 type:complete len:329 (+) Transcript_16040:109-1095(+)